MDYILLLFLGLLFLLVLYRLKLPKTGETSETSETSETPSYRPRFTFPIPGICEDGELVDVVLKRLENEGNQDKTNYFRQFMNISD